MAPHGNETENGGKTAMYSDRTEAERKARQNGSGSPGVEANTAGSLGADVCTPVVR